MTIKEAIETLQANYPDACYEQLRDAVDVAITILKQADITDEYRFLTGYKEIYVEDDIL